MILSISNIHTHYAFHPLIGKLKCWSNYQLPMLVPLQRFLKIPMLLTFIDDKGWVEMGKKFVILLKKKTSSSHLEGNITAIYKNKISCDEYQSQVIIYIYRGHMLWGKVAFRGMPKVSHINTIHSCQHKIQR